MWWIGVVVVMLMGCARGPDMRPRGRRNAFRIETIERKLAAMEGKPYTAPDPAKAADQAPAQNDRIDELRADVLALQKTVHALEGEVRQLRAGATPPTPAP